MTLTCAAVTEIRTQELDTLAAAVCAGERRALARAITLIESTRPDHRRDAEALLERLLPHCGGATRLGISGAPGVGKSTFIEAFGLALAEAGHKIAVLAIDPSSARGGGAILGDKTRMEELARSDAAFIRPSPSGGTLGGVARRTREAMLACEAAGYGVVIVETVGVGQSEIAVRDVADMFVLLMQPGGGDELQGLKRGIVEIADLLVVTKADGDLKAAAGQATAAYQSALGLLRPLSPEWTPQVLQCSALTGAGIEAVWTACQDYRAALGEPGLKRRRAAQAVAWMWDEINETLEARLRDAPELAKRVPALERQVAAGTLTPTAAASSLLDAFFGGDGPETT